MKRCVILVPCVWFALMLAAGSAHAAGKPGKPSIDILAPHSGAVVHGSTIVVRVAVHNFRLAKPVFSNPPILKGYAGHIHYALDGVIARSGMTASTTHTLNGVKPGTHSIKAYLATAQHVPFPGVKAATVSVRVANTTPKPTVRGSSHPAGGTTVPPLAAAPTTGGAADISRSPMNFTLLAAGALALLLGLAFLGRRLAFAGFAAGNGDESSREIPPEKQSSSPGFDVMASAESIPPAVPEEPSSSPLAESEPDPGILESDPGPPAIDPARLYQPQPDPPGEPAPRLPAAEHQSPRADVTPPIDQEEPQGALPASEQLPPHGPSTAPRPSGTSAPVESVRDQALSMAREWGSVVESLVRRLDEQAAERSTLLERVRELEQAVHANQAFSDRLDAVSIDALSLEDLQAIKYVTDSLVRDPDHIVVLASVAQHADKLRDVVDGYVRLRSAIENP
ncbi:MAG: hypothetical protein ACRDFX_02935 [Chloroflexota bacterium]